MTEKIILTSEVLAALYAIPESDWTAISKRVGGVLVIASDPGYKDKMPHVFPHWDQLLESCEQWRDTTFPELEEQARALNDHASQALRDFQHLEREIDALDEKATSLPDNIAREVKATIEKLRQSTILLGEAFSSLADQISVFRDANEQFDADIDALKARGVLQDWWEMVWGSMRAVYHAAGLVVGGWNAIASDLEEISSGEIDITMPFSLKLGLDTALISWRRIRRETHAFSSIAEGQQKYLTGRWLYEQAGTGVGGAPE